jgi:hypothetical protein
LGGVKMDKILAEIDSSKKDEIIKFLCEMLFDNTQACPGSIYGYEGDKNLCNGCEEPCHEECEIYCCWLKLAIHDIGLER